MKSLKTVGLTAMIGTMLALSACGGNNDASSSKSSNASKDNGTEQLSGQIKLDGSSTVYPIMEAIVEEYQAEQPNVKVSVASSGTGGPGRCRC